MIYLRCLSLTILSSILWFELIFDQSTLSRSVYFVTQLLDNSFEVWLWLVLMILFNVIPSPLVSVAVRRKHLPNVAFDLLVFLRHPLILVCSGAVLLLVPVSHHIVAIFAARWRVIFIFWVLGITIFAIVFVQLVIHPVAIGAISVFWVQLGSFPLFVELFHYLARFGFCTGAFELGRLKHQGLFESLDHLVVFLFVPLLHMLLHHEGILLA